MRIDPESQFIKWIDQLKELKRCRVDYPCKGNVKRAMLTNPITVLWADDLRPQYNESNTKIGYVDQQSKGVRLDIDFVSHTINENDAIEMMNMHPEITQISWDAKAPTSVSYWRYKHGESFNTFTLCVRNNELHTVDLNTKEWSTFLQRIVDGAN